MTQCCERDTDHDGNCDRHSAPGVLRRAPEAFERDVLDTLRPTVRAVVREQDAGSRPVQMTDEDAARVQALVAGPPPPGWFKLTVRLEEAPGDAAIVAETLTILGAGELRDRPLADVVGHHATTAFATVRAALRARAEQEG